jgi:predicted DNA-binding transcriptional regulator AlpA
VGENLKLSEASRICGVSASTLKLLLSDQLLPQAVRTQSGHVYLPDDDLPTWEQCRQLVEQRRDHLLQRAAKLIERAKVELEAISNDIAEAREHPAEPLGVDLLSSATWAQSGQTTLATVLRQFDLARMNFEQYHDALVEIHHSARR